MQESDKLDAFLIGAAFGVIATTMVLLTFARIYGFARRRLPGRRRIFEGTQWSALKT